MMLRKGSLGPQRPVTMDRDLPAVDMCTSGSSRTPSSPAHLPGERNKRKTQKEREAKGERAKRERGERYREIGLGCGRTFE